MSRLSPPPRVPRFPMKSPIPRSGSPVAAPAPASLLVLALGLVAAGLGSGCGKKSADADLQLPTTPAKAAAQVEEVFATAEPEARETASAASEAVRAGNYEKAVVALQSLKARQAPSLEQGLAVHGYMVNLEAQLIQAAEAGDANAKRAYELLKRMKAK